MDEQIRILYTSALKYRDMLSHALLDIDGLFVVNKVEFNNSALVVYTFTSISYEAEHKNNI